MQLEYGMIEYGMKMSHNKIKVMRIDETVGILKECATRRVKIRRTLKQNSRGKQAFSKSYYVMQLKLAKKTINQIQRAMSVYGSETRTLR